MAETSGRYWFVGFVFAVVGLWSGWWPSSLSAAAAEKPAASAIPSSSAAADAAPATSSSSPPPDSAATPPPPAPLTGPCARGRELLDEYFSLYETRPARADYLLALVPDPELNAHSSNFSAVLEGLEEALAAEETLVPDRKWLPWGIAGSNCAESAPGVLLFRPSDPKAPPRVVFLVGETPTWGARTKQLAAALAQIPVERPPLAHLAPLKVLGPTFSGTADSLRAQLVNRGAFELVSGTATSPELPGKFPGPLTSFSATLPNDDDLLNAMLEYLRPRGGEAGRIAILSEAGTAYGKNVSGTKEQAQPARRATAARDQLIELRFPVEFDSLRQAIAVAPAPSASANAAEPESPHTLVLDEVARELSEQRVRFVGVVASDPADVVLLIQRLRSRIPDARFFTLGGDIQLSDPALSGLLNGTLVAHAAAPDAIDDAMYKYAITRSVSLKSEVVRNVYLAGRKLLGHEPPRPAVRISLIGNGSLWEIGDRAPNAPVPRSYWKVLVASIAVLCCVLVVVLWPWLSQQLPSLAALTLSRSRSQLSLAFSACARADLAADDALVNAALLSVVSGAVLLLVVGVCAKTHTVECAVAAVLALLVCWSQVFRLIARGKFKGAMPSALVCSLLATAATGLALGMGCGGRHEATLNLLSGGSGVLAGLIGFGMFTVGLWCWRVRLRFLDTHRFSACSKANEPPLARAFAETADSGNGLFDAEKQLLAVIHSPWSALPGVPVAVHLLLLASVLLVYSVRAPAAFEPGWRNALVIGFGLLSLLPITVNFSRIVATWIALSRMLRHLSLFPILEPLRKLPKKLARNLEQQLTVPHADLTELGPSIELLNQIAQKHSSYKDDAEQAERSWLAALRGETALVDATATSSEPEKTPLLSPGGIVNLLLDAAAEFPDAVAERHEFRALLVAVFVPRYLRHFRLFIVPVLVGSVLGVMMTSLYFLQPQRLISMVVFVWVTGMVAGAFLVYSALDRTAIVSAIGDTTEGSVAIDWNVLSRFLSWGIVPLLSLFAAQNSSFPNWVSVLVNTLSKALR